ncbi:MAG TPA: hypothetical protein VMF55_11285 [Solirubrobacterales bacterium]|nr:hypothetical protein [Solirubrobacterales bacterium]
MKRLRHPIRAIREPFGTAGLIVAVVALIAALGGSALAASGALTSKQKKEVEKIAKKYAGKPGVAGAAGPTGPAGAAGPAGPAGSKGDKGDTGATGGSGKDGSNGSNGEGVTITSYSGPQCHGEGEVGAKFTNATGTAYACNGAAGSGGGGGGGWSDTLPTGKTETGVWSLTGNSRGEATGALSWSVPLESSAPASVAVDVTDEDGDGTCTGTIDAPTAPTGTLCVYESAESNLAAPVEVYTPDFAANGVGTSGAYVFQATTNSQSAMGTFAITAP